MRENEIQLSGICSKWNVLLKPVLGRDCSMRPLEKRLVINGQYYKQILSGQRYISFT